MRVNRLLCGLLGTLWLVSTQTALSNPGRTIAIPGTVTDDMSAFALVSKADMKMSHKPVIVGQYSFVPKVGKCWNVGAYKLKRGNQVLAHGEPDQYWPNTTYYTVITPLIVPKSQMVPQRLGNYPGDFAKKMKGPLKAYAPGYSFCGSGGPEIVIEKANCGVKCLHDYWIFSVGPKFKQLLKLDGGNDGINFVDLGADGSIEALGWDSTFENWKFSSASSARPPIVLHLKSGKASLATEYMKMPPPTPDYMSKIVAETRKAFQPPAEGSSREVDAANSDDIIIPYELLSNFLALVYSGNGDAAWTYLDQVWPKRDPVWESETVLTEKRTFITKAQFIAEVKKQLQTSPYWNEIKWMNSQQKQLLTER